MLNFVEMNKLWVRMQHQGLASDQQRRERERRELQDLIGKNLQAMSQLDGVTADLYSRAILPRVLEQVVACQDVIAQQYLMECLIQAFPDEFHLQTVPLLMTAVSRLQPGVALHAVIGSLLSRLSDFAASGPDRLPLLQSAAAQLDSACRDLSSGPAGLSMPAADLVKLHLAQMRFGAGLSGKDPAKAGEILRELAERLGRRRGLSGGPDAAFDAAGMEEATAMLEEVVRTYGLTVALELEGTESLR